MSEKTKYCPHCGTMIDYDYTICPSCGKPQPALEGQAPAYRAPRKNPVVAVILSLLITGLGQVYLGLWRRGLSFAIASLSVNLLLGDMVTWDQAMLVGAAFGIMSAIDAYFVAKGINRS
jgi:TM2 domain-containing membrane protein YozV